MDTTIARERRYRVRGRGEEGACKKAHEGEEDGKLARWDGNDREKKFLHDVEVHVRLVPVIRVQAASEIMVSLVMHHQVNWG